MDSVELYIRVIFLYIWDTIEFQDKRSFLCYKTYHS